MAELKIDVYQKIFAKVLNFLSYKPRTQKEIELKLNFYLRKEKIPQQEKDSLSEKILLQLEQDGYLDDSRVADMFVQSFTGSNKARSIKNLKNSMIKKGFSRYDVEIATGGLPTDLELDGALRVAKKKLLHIKEASKPVKKAKISNFLYAKGYSSSTIKAVVDTLLPLQ